MSLLGYCGYGVAVAMLGIGASTGASDNNKDASGQLPPPVLASPVSLEEAIAQRRSVRVFEERPLTPQQISQLCWAGQGITDARHGLRASPSAGALYPMELYIVRAEGVDHYLPDGHRLDRHLGGDLHPALRRAALDQEAVGEAPVCVVVAAVVKRTARKYGDRAERYCFIEAGHVAQNILLQATALDLAGVPVGAFEDRKVAAALKLPQDHRVLYLLPIGHPSR